MLNKLLSMLFLKVSIWNKAKNTVNITKNAMQKEIARKKRTAGLRSRMMTGRRRLPTSSWTG